MTLDERLDWVVTLLLGASQTTDITEQPTAFKFAVVGSFAWIFWFVFLRFLGSSMILAPLWVMWLLCVVSRFGVRACRKSVHTDLLQAFKQRTFSPALKGKLAVLGLMALQEHLHAVQLTIRFLFFAFVLMFGVRWDGVQHYLVETSSGSVPKAAAVQQQVAVVQQQKVVSDSDKKQE